MNTLTTTLYCYAAIGLVAHPVLGDLQPVATTDSQWSPIVSKFIYNIPLVEATIDGSTGWFILDSGASEVLCDEEWAKESHSEVSDREVNGIKIVFIKSAILIVGSSKTQLHNVPCGNFAAYSERLGLRVGGVIGYNYFIDHVVRIRYADKVVEVGTQRPTTRAGDIEVPIGFERTPQTSCFVSHGTSDRVGARFIIDTGCYYGLLLGQQPLRHMKLTPEPGRIRISTFEGASSVLVTTGVALTLCGIRFSETDAVVDEKEIRFDGIIGAQVLSQFAITLDYKNGIILLSPGIIDKPLPKASGGLGFGIHVAPDNTVLTITEVADGLGKRAGLQDGDVLLAVSGIPASADNIAILSRQIGELRRTEKPIPLRIQRGKEVLELTIITKDNDTDSR